ncbi:MAG: hypothetical protein L0338_39075 [Acidobacteria bacterium]|nr:hypothetical protein [Acidobacteriota bacterium]
MRLACRVCLVVLCFSLVAYSQGPPFSITSAGKTTTANFNNLIVLEGVKYPQTRAGLVSAISDAGSGGCVLIPANVTITISSTDGPVTWNQSNVCLLGSGPSSVIAVSGTGNFGGALRDGSAAGALQFSGSAGSTANLASNAVLGSNTVTLVAGSVAALGLAVGDVVFFDDTQSEPTQFTSRILSIAGETLTLADPVYADDLTTARGARVREVTPLRRIIVGNLRIDGSGNTGTDTTGIQLAYAMESIAFNLWLESMKGSAIRWVRGYYNRSEKIHSVGNATDNTTSSIEWVGETAHQFSNIQSRQEVGFGPQFLYGAANKGNGLYVADAKQRGFKVRHSKFNVFSDLLVNNTGAAGATGIVVSDGSKDNTFTGCQAVGNTESGAGAGIWLPGSPNQDNDRNLFANCRLAGNNEDISIASGSDDNQFLAIKATGIITNAGARNFIQTVDSDGHFRILSGQIRIPNDSPILGRNAAGTGDVGITKVQTDNVLGIGGGTGVRAYGGSVGLTEDNGLVNHRVLTREADDFTTRASHTGTTAETVIRSITVPANHLGTNGCFEVLVSGQITNGGTPGQKDIRLKFDGNTLFTVTRSATFQSAWTIRATVCNRNATNSQFYEGFVTKADSNDLSQGNTTLSVDTSVAKNITITGQLTNSGDTIHVDMVHLVYKLR